MINKNEKNEYGWTQEQLDQFGRFRSEDEAQAVRDALGFANAELAKIGLADLVAIMEGYPDGWAWLVTAPETEPSGKARIRAREHGETTVAAIRRLLVRTLTAYRHLRD